MDQVLWVLPSSELIRALALVHRLADAVLAEAGDGVRLALELKAGEGPLAAKATRLAAFVLAQSGHAEEEAS